MVTDESPKILYDPLFVVTDMAGPRENRHGSVEIMSQHFHIWRDKQTIQGLWPNCIWRDKQNQCKDLVFESKTGKSNCILHKNSSLDFIQA